MCAWGLSGPAGCGCGTLFSPLRPCGRGCGTLFLPSPALRATSPARVEAGLIGYVQTLSVTERASLAAFYFLRDPLANIIKVRVYLCICKAQNF